MNDLLVGLGIGSPVYWVADDGKLRKPADKLIIPHELRGEPDIERNKALGLGTFFTVNETGEKPNDKGNYRYAGNITRARACFADFDHGSFEEQVALIAESPMHPSAIVKSGHGYHLYWFLEGDGLEDLGRWTRLQKAIAHRFGSDTQVSDPGRLMRLPGSWHCKDEGAYKMVELTNLDASLRFTLGELEKEFPPAPPEAQGYGVEALISGTTAEGGRFEGAQKVIGSVLNKYRPAQWETVAWPLVTAWNKEHCKPPKAEHLLREQFDALSKLELKKRAADQAGVTTFAEDEMAPQVEGDDERVTVRIPVDDGIARFVFESIEQTKGDSLETVLSVDLLIPGSVPRPFIQRINLLSGSSMEGLARQLGKSLGKPSKVSWEHLLNTAQVSLIGWLAHRDQSMDLTDVPDEEAPNLFAPFLVKDGANLLFGDGGTGKTYFCLRLCISLITGKEFLGYSPQETTNVLFIDYEDNEKTASYRLSRLCADPALGLDPKDVKRRIRYLNPQGAPLHTIVPAMRKIVREHNIGLVLVDSVASACGAEPEKAEAASRYYNALKSLNVTSLSIAHVSKSEGSRQDKAFGSVFWHNLARNTWNIQGEEDAEGEVGTLESVMGDKSRTLGMFHRKFNSGPKSRPISMRITYGLGNVRFEEAKAGTGFSKDKKAEERVVDALRKNGPMDKAHIAEELLNVPDKTLKNTLLLLKNRGAIRKQKGKGAPYELVGTTPGTGFGTILKPGDDLV